MEKLLVCIIFHSQIAWLEQIFRDGICVYVLLCEFAPQHLFHLSLSISPHVWAAWVNWAALELIALALWALCTLCELWLGARLRNLDDCAWVESCWLLLTHWFSIRNHNLSTIELTLSGKKKPYKCSALLSHSWNGFSTWMAWLLKHSLSLSFFLYLTLSCRWMYILWKILSGGFRKSSFISMATFLGSRLIRRRSCWKYPLHFGINSKFFFFFWVSSVKFNVN